MVHQRHPQALPLCEYVKMNVGSLLLFGLGLGIIVMSMVLHVQAVYLEAEPNPDAEGDSTLSNVSALGLGGGLALVNGISYNHYNKAKKSENSVGYPHMAVQKILWCLMGIGVALAIYSTFFALMLAAKTPYYYMVVLICAGATVFFSVFLCCTLEKGVDHMWDEYHAEMTAHRNDVEPDQDALSVQEERSVTENTRRARGPPRPERARGPPRPERARGPPRPERVNRFERLERTRGGSLEHNPSDSDTAPSTSSSDLCSSSLSDGSSRPFGHGTLRGFTPGESTSSTSGDFPKSRTPTSTTRNACGPAGSSEEYSQCGSEESTTLSSTHNPACPASGYIRRRLFIREKLARKCEA